MNFKKKLTLVPQASKGGTTNDCSDRLGLSNYNPGENRNNQITPSMQLCNLVKMIVISHLNLYVVMHNNEKTVILYYQFITDFFYSYLCEIE